MLEQIDHQEFKKHLKLFWLSLVFLSAVYSAAESPLQIVLQQNVSTWRLAISLLVSLVFVVDFAYHIRSFKSDGTSFFSQKKARYVSLIVDALACIPFDLFSYAFGYEEVFAILRLLCLVRIIKIQSIVQEMSSVPSILRTMFVFAVFLLIVHWIACGWIYIYPPPPDVTNQSYYVQSFYWAITTLTTVGYGDITPKDDVGRIFTCFMMIIGVGMYGIVIGNITRIMAHADRHKEKSREKISDLEMLMKHYNIPKKIKVNALAYYDHLRSTRLSADDDRIIADLPETLQMQIRLYMCVNLIRPLSIFAKCTEDCLKDIAMCLERFHSNPGDLIIQFGEIGYEMYILAHGTVDVCAENGELISTLHGGQIFGEMALLQQTGRNANVISTSYCDIYKLHVEHLNDLTLNHPILLENIKKLDRKKMVSRSK